MLPAWRAPWAILCVPIAGSAFVRAQQFPLTCDASLPLGRQIAWCWRYSQLKPVIIQKEAHLKPSKGLLGRVASIAARRVFCVVIQSSCGHGNSLSLRGPAYCPYAFCLCSLRDKPSRHYPDHRVQAPFLPQGTPGIRRWASLYHASIFEVRQCRDFPGILSKLSCFVPGSGPGWTLNRRSHP